MRQRHLMDIMVDVLLLAGGEGFVGHFSSNVSRLVVALATYARGTRIRTRCLLIPRVPRRAALRL